MNLLTCSKQSFFAFPKSKRISRLLTPQIEKAMKLTFISLTILFLHASATGWSQNVTIQVKNAPVEKVFMEIERQTGIGFLYGKKMLLEAGRVTIDVKNAPLTEVLKQCFAGQPLDYAIQENTIVITKKPPVILKEEVSVPKMETALNIDVHGRVVNENDEPLEGITVTVKGTNQGTSTDKAGAYNLPGVAENATLVFTGVNIERSEIKLNGRSQVPVITLKTRINSMAETVVVGYGTTKRKDLTGSVASINMKEIKNTPFTTIDQALAGKASGVQVTQADGSPGGVAKIRIRGGASLIGGNDPLYIIDGIPVTIQNRYIQSAADVINPVENLGNDANYSTSAVGSSFARGLNTLAGLNLNDIESIDILKDASATAIYGSKAANGVVIITTKKGKTNQKPVLEANYYAGMSNAVTEKLLTADQYRAVMLEGAKNQNALLVQQGQPEDPIATSIINDPNFLGAANTDWLKLVTRTGITHNADLSIRGGGTGSRYYTSLSYTNQTGTLKGTDFNRLAGKINLDNEITNKLRVITNLDYGFTSNDITNGIYSSALFTPPTLDPYNADGSPAVFDPVSFGSYSGSGIQNPLTLLQGINKTRNVLLLGSLALEYDVLKSLKFRSTASVSYNNYHQLNYIPSSLNVYSSSGLTGVSSQGGIATQAQSQQTDAFYENTLTWDKQFNKDNRLNLLVGTSWQQTKSQSFSASGQGFPDDKFLNGLSSAALALPPTASETQSSLLSFYMRANYALKEKYLLTLTGRSDESSKFPKNNRIGYFPSFGVAWKASEEPFFKNIKWVNELKFRASAGYTGTQNLGDNLFYTLYTPGSYASSNALIASQLGNDRIKWENTLQKDAGVDFALFNSKLRGAVGYYNKQSTGLLIATPVATSSGFTSALVNLADINNKGVEIELRTDILHSKNTTWTLAMNVSQNRSRVTHISHDLQNPNSVGYSDPFYNSNFSLGNTILREGQSVGLIYGYIYKGVIKTQKELDDYKAKSLYARYGLLDNLALGYPMYGIIDTGNYKGYFAKDVIGNAEPKFYGGITNTISYKQFSLIALISFSYGGDLLYLPDLNSFGLTDRGNRNTRILLPHYSSSDTTANRPSLILGESNRFGTGVSNADVHDASYLKLKSISINYELPARLVSRLHMRTAMFYISGSNLFTITKYPGADPEISNDPYSLISGYSDAATYPSMRQYTVGLRLGF